MRTEFEEKAWSNQKVAIGIDEAGRGPLAGPCVVCGVVFPIGYSNDQINDSKQLSASKREKLLETIRKDAVEIIVEVVDVDTIDRLNIYQATKQAMRKIAYQSKASYVLTDAMPFVLEGKDVVDIVKGDAKSVSIAAASIIAKTTRDDIMVEYSIQYPEYGFDKHKGYGTAVHVAAIEKYGYLPIHRKSFHLKAKQQTLDL